MSNASAKQALKYLESGRIKQAEEIYDAYCPQQPDDKLSWHYWCVVKIQRKDYTKATEIIDKLLTDNNKEIEYHLTKARILTAQKDYASAEKIYLRLLETANDKSNLHLQLGTFYYHTEQTTKAITQYKLALEKNPHPEIRFNYALTLAKDQQLDLATTELKKVIEKDSQHLKAHFQLAEILREQQHYQQALPYYQKILSALPQHIDAKLGIAYCLEKQGLQTEAIDQLQKIIQGETSVLEAHELLAKLYGTRREHKLAIKQYNDCISLQPHNEYYYNIAVHYMDLQHFKEAESYFKQVLKQDAKHYPSLQNLGAIYLKMRNIPAAIGVYKQAESLSPHPEEIRHILSALENNKPAAKPPSSFVRRLFDSYALRYDEHLTAFLEYQVPTAVKIMLENSTALDSAPLSAIDLGCGTGLSAPWLKPLCKKFTGVDLSADMLELAREKNIYDQLVEDDISQALKQLEPSDLIIAADVLTYIGDLQEIFQATFDNLKANGFFIFSVESSSGDEDYILHHSLRYAHKKQPLVDLAKQTGFEVDNFEQLVIRKDHGREIIGYLVLLKKPGS